MIAHDSIETLFFLNVPQSLSVGLEAQFCQIHSRDNLLCFLVVRENTRKSDEPFRVYLSFRPYELFALSANQLLKLTYFSLEVLQCTVCFRFMFCVPQSESKANCCPEECPFIPRVFIFSSHLLHLVF